MKKKPLILFDFDGTITRGDSLLEFLWHMVGPLNALIALPGVLLDWLWLAMKWNLSHDTAKEALLKAHMPRRTRTAWNQAVRDFNATQRSGYFNPEVLTTLRRWHAEGATVAVVSASIDIWLTPFTEAEGIELICTRSAWKEERWIGFLGPNCRGEEKVKRILEAFPPQEYEYLEAFGNTSSDFPMLALARKGWLVRRNGTLKPWKTG